MTLTIYLVWAALSPVVCLFALFGPFELSGPFELLAPFALLAPSARAAEPSGQSIDARLRRATIYVEHGKGREALPDLDAVVKASPSWHNYLMRANALVQCAPDDVESGQKAGLAISAIQATRATRAIKDCQSSLTLQKNPLGYYLLTRAYMLAGPSHLKDALKASQNYVSATAGAPDSYELEAFTAFLSGDLTTSREALANYTAGEVRVSHPESRMILRGPVSQMSARELAVIMRNMPAAGGPKGQMRSLIFNALIDFFRQHYQQAAEVRKNFQSKFAAPGFVAESDFALTLTVCADLLQLHNEAARDEVTALLKREPIDNSTLLLLDTVYYALNRREDGLKILAQHESTNKRVCILARVRVLDDMEQPREALDALKALAKISPNDDDLLLQSARLNSQLNKNDEALSRLHQYITKHPLAGQAYFLRALIYVQKSQWEPALSDLTRAINGNYSLVKAVRARSGCYKSLGQMGPARDDMNLAETFMHWVR